MIKLTRLHTIKSSKIVEPANSVTVTLTSLNNNYIADPLTTARRRIIKYLASVSV